MITKLNASYYCKDLLELDDQILAVVVIDENGEILAEDWKADRVPWETQGLEARKIFDGIERKLGVWMKLILSLARETAPLIGGIERAEFVHKKYQLVIIGLPSMGNDIGLMLTRSADLEHINNLIKEMLG